MRGSHRVRSTDSKPTCGHEHNSRPQLMRARKPSCSGRSSSTLASAVCQSTFARLRSWRAVPTLLSAASRRTWRADHRGGGRNVDAGGRGRAMSVLVCSKAAIRAVGWTDAEERCREAASTLGQNAEERRECFFSGERGHVFFVTFISPSRSKIWFSRGLF